MNLTEFFNTIQKYGDGSFSIPVLNDFLTTPNNPDITNFFDLYKQDSRLASSVDSKKYAKVIGKILEDHKSYGGDPASITSALQKNPNKMTISSMDVRNLNLHAERMHKFTINVSGVLLYDVVEKMYDFAKELDYDLDMEIPAAKDQKLGLTDTIILYSSNNNLFNTLDFIKNLETISNSFGEQPKYTVDREKKSYYAEVSNGIAYDSYNAEHQKWNRDIVGETIIEAIDNMIVNFVADNFDLYGSADSINYKNDRVKIIRDMMDQDIDVYVTFNSYLEKGFKAKNIDPDNIYLSETVREKFFGPRVNIVDQLEEEFRNKYDEEDDLEAAIEQMTSDLLGHMEKLGLEENGEQPFDLSSSEEEVAEQAEGDSLNLLGEQEEDFTPLTENLERVDPGSVRVLGLNPNPLNPLEYLTPQHPTANLRRLDELSLTDNNIGQNQGQEEQAIAVETFFDEKSAEEGQKNLQEGIQEEVQEEINIGDALDEAIVEDGSLNEQSFGENITLSSAQEEVIEGETLEEEVLDEQPQFGDNITIPGAIEEMARDLAQSIIPEGEELDPEQQQVAFNVDNIFGEGLLDDLATAHDNDGKDEHQGEEREISGTQEEQAQENTFAVQTGKPEKNDLLSEFRKRRAAEIAAMEAASDKKELALTSDNIREKLGSGVTNEPNPNEAYLDQLLETTLNGTGNSGLEAEEETFKRTKYTHIPSAEEQRLLELEQGKGQPNSNELLIVPPTPAIKPYVPPKKGDAELYLESVLASALDSNKTSEFNGFSSDMLLEDTEVGVELTPSSVFEENVARAEVAEEKKSPAEKRIEAMLAALDKKNNNASGISQGDGIERQPYHHEVTAEEQRLEEVLKTALEPSESFDYSGFNEELFAKADDQAVVENSAKLLGLSAENAEAQAKRREEEERFDAMLRGEYQPPAVVIEKMAPVQPYKREKTAEELRLEGMLSNVGKEVPAVIVEEKKLERIGYQQVKSDKELELEQKLADALTPKKPILGSIKDEMTNVPALPSSVKESESYLDKLLDATINGTGQEEVQEEFTGFGNIVGDQNHLETALNAEDVEKGKETAADEERKALNEQEEYLNGLLNNLPDANEARKAALEEETKIVPIAFERKLSEEELRLQEVEAEALAPKEPVLGAISEIPKTSVVPSSQPNEEESYLDQLLDMTEGLENQGDSQFTGFTPEMQGDNQLEFAGQQGLLALSLEEKINQIAAMERRKSQHERDLDHTLQQALAGANGETSLVPVQPQQVSVLRNIMEESMAQEEGEVVGSDNKGKSDAVKVAEELFADTNTSGVSEILDKQTKEEAQENYLQDLLKNIEEVPVEEVAVGSDGDVQEGEKEEAFNGFGEVFFDDGVTEEDGLAAALSGVPILPLSFADLTEAEKEAMLNMESLQEERMQDFEPLFGASTEEVMNTVIADNNGNESKVIDFFEDNNVLTYIPEDAIVEVDGEELSRNDFICRKLVPDLISNGRFDFFDYLEANQIDVKYKSPEGGFFPGV